MRALTYLAIGGLLAALFGPTPEPEVSIRYIMDAPAVYEMDPGIDTWAGLSTPARQVAPGKREEAKVCLALNIYHEARGESYEGQVAVAQVTLRRAGMDYRRACAEVYKPHQFSWTAARERHGKLPTGDAWQWARAAAEQAMEWARTGEGHDFSRGASHYHTVDSRPYWSREFDQVAVLGDHIFYRGDR